MFNILIGLSPGKVFVEECGRAIVGENRANEIRWYTLTNGRLEATIHVPNMGVALK
jgi:hypothetical protein